ncbi:MAG: hypothetical protein ABL999_18170 [Pyrinomonadaceae bacterium]
MADRQFPTSESEINLFLQNMAIKLPGFQVTLGLTLAEVATLGSDADNYNYIISTAPQVNDTKDAFYSFKSELIDGEPDTTAIVPPVFPIIATPDPALPGIIRRTRNLIRRIKSAPGYTPIIGEDLGLVIDDAAPLDPENLTASLSLKALSDSRVEITFSKQGLSGMRVEFKRKNDANWGLAGIFIVSPGFHVEPSIPEDEPESRQYRGYLLDKNEPVGNVSPIYTIVTTP